MTIELLIISRNFPPLVGGMEKLVWQAFGALSTEYRCTVIGPRGCGKYVPQPHRAVECNEASVPRFLYQAARAALQLSRETNFALVIAGSGVTAPLCGMLRRRRGMPSMVFLHGLDIVVDSLLYRLFWLPVLRRTDYVVANSDNTAQLARGRGILPAGMRVIHPGVRMPDDQDSQQSREQFLATGPLLLSLGRIVRRKGLLEFIENCMPTLVAKHPGLRLLVIGDEPASALKRDAGILRQIQAAVGRLELGDSVSLHGRGSDAEVTAALHAADLLVFPLIHVDGDVEGFGMVALEAAAHGTPTAAFACGGVGDAIIDGATGFLVEAGDYQQFTTVVSAALTGNAREKMQARCVEFARSKDWNRYGNELRAFVASAIAESK